MNEELIRKLAKQALDYSQENQSPDIPNHWIGLFTEKLSELVVRECAKVCNDVDAEYEGEDVLASWCATAIKEHFGVEEG